jgi:hypothetical protein
MPSLLDLPAAIRDQIWALFILNSQGTATSLLLVSRQVYEESLPFMYRQPLAFESQYDLYVWLERVGTSNLQNVDALSICIKLEDNRPVAERNGNYSQHSVVAGDELGRIQLAFQHMPNVTTLAVYKHLSDERMEYMQLYDGVLRSLNRMFPHIKSLAAHTDSHSLDFLRHMCSIERLQFTGFASSSPMETEAILSHLRHLTEIEIIPSLRSRDYRPPSPRRTSLQPCLSREVLRSLRLTGLIIHESQSLNHSAPEFWTAVFLQVIPALRRHSFTKFGVVLDDFAPDANCAELFCTFLKQSHIQNLTVEWDGAIDIASDVLDALPRALIFLRLGRLVGSIAAATLLNEISIRKTSGQIPNLREVVIVQDNCSSDSVSSTSSDVPMKHTRTKSK